MPRTPRTNSVATTATGAATTAVAAPVAHRRAAATGRGPDGDR
ncbi:hypothetical protein [Streptomyces olivaceoviridis]